MRNMHFPLLQKAFRLCYFVYVTILNSVTVYVIRENHAVTRFTTCGRENVINVAFLILKLLKVVNKMFLLQ